MKWMIKRMNDSPNALKDEEAEHPIAENWRPMLKEVVCAFSKGDFELKCGVAGVDRVEPDVAVSNREHVIDYGEELVELTNECWNRSCAQWMGTHWEVLIDLCTKDEGVSDLVLTGKVVEVNGKIHFSVGHIYVP
jgi:hypothetical protein